MILAALPGRALHGAVMYSTAGAHDVLLDVGTVFGSDDHYEVVSVRMPYLDDALGHPLELEMEVIDQVGDVLKARVEVLATASVTYNEDNDNLNGLEWDAPDAIVLNESRVRIHLPGGEVGLGYLERGVRLEELRRRRGGR